MRNAKDLENFLWDMEQYFEVAHIFPREQVTLTTMYLSGDAKLWWNMRSNDDAKLGRLRTSTLETLKKELKDQFFPSNMAWMARESLKRLKQIETITDYVKEFSSLILDIKDMSEVDKLFNFMSGLQKWTQIELRFQGVREIPSAIVAVDFLVDYRLDASSLASKKGKGQ